jgi:hypothetical protein
MSSPVPVPSESESESDIPVNPLPNGVDWTSGAVLPALTGDDLQQIDEDDDEVRDRGGHPAAFAMAEDSGDPNVLADAGWGVIFGPGIGDDIKQALAPLFARRETEAGGSYEAGGRYRAFTGVKAYRVGESVRQWLTRQDVGFATVAPERGVPLYLLIVASPQDIPFEFQYLLDTYWNVGRLYFDDGDAAKYARYAAHVIAYETADTLPHGKRAAIFATSNPGDRATGFFNNQVAKPFAQGNALVNPIGQKLGFTIDALLGKEATKPQLCDLLAGKRPSGRPALLLTGSHGVFADETISNRLDKIGAIVTQEWEPGDPLTRDSTFSASDLAALGGVEGLVHYFFACYSGGCPAFDTYKRQPDGTRKRLLDATMVARLPQTMLATGSLGVIAHIDRAFACSFQNDRSGPMTQDIHSVLTRIVKGIRLGQALDDFNRRWSVLSAELSELLRDRESDPGAVSDDLLANRWLTRDDARNYLLLGDPAVRLRTEKMV